MEIAAQLANPEMVYGTSQDDSHVMSERIQSLADSVYKEFERLIKEYDENVVKDMMPLVVGILENLDQACRDKQQNEVDLELIREDNEQLITQYEREKQLRKATEQKYLALDDAMEEERKQLQGKCESLESIVRMFEIKLKNSQDQILRLEEKETETKKDYNKLHERYTDLFKAHVDFREKTKLTSGTDRMSLELSTARKVAPVPIHHVFNLMGPNNQDSLLVDKFLSVSPSSACPSFLPSHIEDMDSMNIEQELKSSLFSKEDRDNTRTAEKTSVNEQYSTRCVGDKTDVDERSTDTTKADKHLLTFEGLKPKNERRLLTIGDDLRLSLVGDMPSLQTPECEEFENQFVPQASSVYEELSMQDLDGLGQIDDGADITDDPSNKKSSMPGEMEPDSDKESTGSEVNYYGMSREVENLIAENNELLATKNALNVVKDDLIAKLDEISSEKDILKEEVNSLQVVKDKLKSRILELEDEVKKSRDLLIEKNAKAASADDEDDVPVAQRKRFTRVEMARVLMERNQYKERLMELQEAVRWTEMIRASREHPDSANNEKKRSTVWNFFSNLFSSPNKPPATKKSDSVAAVRYNAPSPSSSRSAGQSKPKPSREKPDTKSNAFNSVQDDLETDRARRERKQQSRQMQACVMKDDGRQQAYGWSLPAKFQIHSGEGGSKQSQVPVPVPVYCRPIMEDDPTTKLWCAAAVNLSGGRTKDGGSIVGASIFYTSPEAEEKVKIPGDEIEKLDQEIKEHEKDIKAIENEQMSSLVWICTTNQNGSEVSIIDADNPGDVLENFPVSSSHVLCIASVPGAMETDYAHDDETIGQNNAIKSSETDQMAPGSITYVQCSPRDSTDSTSSQNDLDVHLANHDPPFLDRSSESNKKVGRGRGILPHSELVKDGISTSTSNNDFVFIEMGKSTSISATMWLGSQSGSIYVYSAVSQWKRCLSSIRLNDSILSITHVKGRVFAALADGTVAIFRRDPFGLWDMTGYHLVTVGEAPQSVRCVCIVANKYVWCGLRNKICILNAQTLTIEKSFDAHPRKESQIRQMTWIGEGVWLSIRLDSTLRLYHAYTHQHLQDVDVEPYVSKLLGNSKLGFSFVRISCLMASCNRLWIGTGNGVIISVPLSETSDSGILTSMSACESNKQSLTTSGAGRPGGVIRVYSDIKTDSVLPGSFIPYCSIAQAQLSFHGHKDAVKFFVTVPGIPSKKRTGKTSKSESLINKSGDSNKSHKHARIISGGEGYVDFRIGEVENGSNTLEEVQDTISTSSSKGDHSHLIVWEVYSS